MIDHNPTGPVVEVDGRARCIDDPRAKPLETVPHITPVPMAPFCLAGLAQVDGEVLPVVWASDSHHVAGIAIVTETRYGRIVLLCTRILSTPLTEPEPLAVDRLIEAVRHGVLS